MAGQCQAKYAAAVGTQLLAKIHVLHEKMICLDQHQDHPIDRLDEHINFVGEATDCDLVGTVESQAKEIKQLKLNQETQRKVLNNLTTKFIALEECVEDVQKKAFPKVRDKDS